MQPPLLDRAIAHLRDADTTLGAVVDAVGPLPLTPDPDLWWSLVDSIVGQQLSVKAAATIASRLERVTGGAQRPTPAELLALPDEAMRACGLSRAKVAYVKDLAARWLDGRLRHQELHHHDDDLVVTELTQVKGVGRWTAEMVLIFCLARPDVLPVGDLGLRNAVQRLYALPDRPGPAELVRLAEPWRPFRSLATRYLWRSLSLPPSP
jgi:DNA-3-methyladenine glycosylase II